MGTPTRRRIGVLSTILGLAAAGIGLTSAPAAADFQGECAPTDASSGTCVVDEINGSNPAVHGTATYEIDGDTLTFEFAGVDAGDAGERV